MPTPSAKARLRDLVLVTGYHYTGLIPSIGSLASGALSLANTLSCPAWIEHIFHPQIVLWLGLTSLSTLESFRTLYPTRASSTEVHRFICLRGCASECNLWLIHVNSLFRTLLSRGELEVEEVVGARRRVAVLLHHGFFFRPIVFPTTPLNSTTMAGQPSSGGEFWLHFFFLPIRSNLTISLSSP